MPLRKRLTLARLAAIWHWDGRPRQELRVPRAEDMARTCHAAERPRTGVVHPLRVVVALCPNTSQTRPTSTTSARNRLKLAGFRPILDRI